MTLKSQPLASTALNRRTISLAAIAVAVTACGGGSSDAPPTTTLPTITTQPSAVSISAGQPAVFHVVAQSSAPLSYQWLRNGVPIPGANGADFSLAAAFTSDSGSLFSVIVSNVAGSVQSSTASLTVHSTGSIALASGALGALGVEQTVVGISKSGDIFVLNRLAKKLVRLKPDGTEVPLLGSLQSLGVDAWRLCIIEHSDESIYVSESYLKLSNQINTEYGNGGKIHRISPTGDHFVIYDHRTAAITLTPTAIAEGQDKQLYVLHLNSISIYRLTLGTGVINKIVSPINETIKEYRVVLGRTSVHLVATDSGNMVIASPGGSFSYDDTWRSKGYEPFSYQVQLDGTLTPTDIGLRDVYDLRALNESLYILGRDSNQSMCLFIRPPGGVATLIAGGTVSGAIQAGPLPGSLQSPTYLGLAGVTPSGQAVVGEVASPWLEQKKFSKYFVITYGD